MSQSFPDDTFLARWLNGELSEAELQQLQHREDYEKLQKIVKRTQNLEIPAYSEEKSWQQLLAKKEQLQQKRKVIPLRRWWIYTAAASVALLLGIYFFTLNAPIKYETEIGEKLAVNLPDGSVVELNAESKLSFKKENWLKARKVKLEGEAFFKVQPSESFIVETKQGKIEVLGTTFNVWDRANWFEVTCHTGKVKVQSMGSQETLERGDRVRSVNKGKLKKDAIEVEESPNWIQGHSKFTDVPILLVFKEMERQFKVKIDYRGRPRSYNGGYPHDDIKGALNLVCGPFSLTYQLEGSIYIVKEKN